MIGVAVDNHERESAREFFELFKTPWEFCRNGESYDVVVTTGSFVLYGHTRLVIVCSARATDFDARLGISVTQGGEGGSAIYGEQSIPLYGESAALGGDGRVILRAEKREGSHGLAKKTAAGACVRLGYNLFEETAYLLRQGQPVKHAGTPVLELHIQVLRDLITGSGLALVEIPPVPQEHAFMVCLTHDLDHPVLRNHCCDATMFGFLNRATVGTARDLLRGRGPARRVGQNLAAVARLPLVYLGLAEDPWRGFTRYLEIEAGCGATYFVIPRKGYAGRRAEGRAPARRASGYAVEDIKRELQAVASAGGELALHGLDSWLDKAGGEAERKLLSEALGVEPAGVRMHWLFFGKDSPGALDEAGFSYDSSVGYNNTVGFRAGTAQAYRPPGVKNLLELPLHIMDTALFYPGYLNLSEDAAEQAMLTIVEQVERYGGALTLNWHDRSIAPERLWTRVYERVLAELKARRAWFPTASQAVAWFRMRRSATFHQATAEGDRVQVNVSARTEPGVPGLRMRVHQPKSQSLFEALPARVPAQYVDTGFKDSLSTSLAIAA